MPDPIDRRFVAKALSALRAIFLVHFKLSNLPLVELLSTLQTLSFNPLDCGFHRFPFPYLPAMVKMDALRDSRPLRRLMLRMPVGRAFQPTDATIHHIRIVPSSALDALPIVRIAASQQGSLSQMKKEVIRLILADDEIRIRIVTWFDIDMMNRMFWI